MLEPDVKAVKYLLEPQDEQPTTIRSDGRPIQHILESAVNPDSDNNDDPFELSFEDNRYLSFEGTGAVSSWRFRLHPIVKATKFDF